MSFASTLYRATKMWGWPQLRKVGIISMTYSQQEPLLVPAWDIATFGNGVHFVGEDARQFFQTQKFHTIILQHWTPPELLAELRRLSPGTVFLFWVAIEAIEPDPAWSGGYQETFRMLLETNYLLMGKDAAPVMIKQPGKDYSALAVNMLEAPLADTVSDRLWGFRRVFGNDGWFFDSATRYSYFANAPNAPNPQDRSAAWPNIIAATRRQDPKVIIWGNTVQPFSLFRDSLDVSFAEQFFYKAEHVAQFAEKIHSKLCVNPQRSAWWGRGEYEPFALECALQGVKDIYVCSAWTGQQLMDVHWK